MRLETYARFDLRNRHIERSVIQMRNDVLSKVGKLFRFNSYLVHVLRYAWPHEIQILVDATEKINR